ncbi:MAG: GNAT family N-acetyltransferase, partial [Candidatus Methylomirabilales bacterium]
MLRVERLNPSQFLELKAEWGALLEGAPGHGIFVTWEWLYTWWECFGGSKSLYLLAARDQDRRLRGILPLCVVRRRWLGLLELKVLQFIGRGIEGRRSAGEYSAGMDLISREEDAAEAAAAFLDYIVERPGDWDLIFLDELRRSSPRTARLVDACRSRLFHAGLHPAQSTYHIDLPGEYEEFRRRLSPKMRANVGRRTRQIERRHRTRVVTVDREEKIGEMLAVYYELIRKRHDKVLPEPRKRFHLELSRRLLENGRLR